MCVRVLVLFACAGSLIAQRSSTSNFDLNGNRWEGPAVDRVETPSGERRVVTTSSINGRAVPVESVEDRIVSKSELGQVIERTVVRYDADGNPGPPEKLRIEQAKSGDGIETVTTTRWRADWNGNLSVAEKSVAVKQADGAAQTRIERPLENGALQVVETITRVVHGPEAETTSFRRDANGDFYTAAREVTLTTKRDGEETTDTTRYERSATSELEAAERIVTKTAVRPDGGKVEQTDIYSRLGADASDTPRLQRQIRSEQTPGPGGAAVIVTSVRPAPNAAYQKVQETKVEPPRP